jgi:hypothetical protein
MLVFVSGTTTYLHVFMLFTPNYVVVGALAPFRYWCCGHYLGGCCSSPTIISDDVLADYSFTAEMPRTVSTYVHRVGRTARAGSGGRAITLITDARRKVILASVLHNS